MMAFRVLQFAFTFIAKKTTGLDPEDPTTLELLKDMEIIVKGLSSIPINLPGTTYGAAIKVNAPYYRITCALAKLAKDQNRIDRF